METEKTMGDLLSALEVILNCSTRTIASLIGVNETTINGAENRGKLLADIRTKKAGKRLIPLAIIVEGLYEKGLGGNDIINLLNKAILPNYSGFRDSVKSSLALGKIEEVELSGIVNLLYKYFTESKTERKNFDWISQLIDRKVAV